MSAHTPDGGGEDPPLPKADLSPNLLHSDWIVCGRFGRPHGVRGEVRLWGYNNHTDLLKEGMTFYVGPHPKHPTSPVKVATSQLNLTRIRSNAKGLLLSFSELKSREAAKSLNHLAWLMPRVNFLPLDDNEFYLVDLIGAEGWAVSPDISDEDLRDLKDEDQQYIGRLTGFLEAGAGDLLIFEGKDFGEVTVPNQDPFVISIDLEQRKVIIRAIPGLLEGGI